MEPPLRGAGRRSVPHATPASFAQGTATSRAPSPTTQPPVFRAGINYVRVDVIISDKSGNPVADLQASDFDVFEDAQRRDQARRLEYDTDVLWPKRAAPAKCRPGQLTARRRIKIGDQVEKCGLSASGAAKECYSVAGADHK